MKMGRLSASLPRLGLVPFPFQGFTLFHFRVLHVKSMVRIRDA
jgi:hypothetical protein